MRRIVKIAVFKFFFVLIIQVQSARILGLFPLGAKSHHRIFQPVMKALAQAGHEVVVYSPFPLNNPPANYTEFPLENIHHIDTNKTSSQNYLKLLKYPRWKCADIISMPFTLLYEEVMKEKAIKQLLFSKERFDLIITEPYISQEFLTILVHVFKAQAIGIQAYPTNNIINSEFGNSLSASSIPDLCFSFSNKMSFFERMLNAVSVLRGVYYYYSYHLPKVETFMRRHFPDMPPLEELTKSVSLVFVNDHLTADYAQPRTPNIIPIGGIHIQPPKPLPQELKEFMDGAQEGVIYFSLGTYVPDELQPKEYFDMYVNVFKKIRQKVLWKTRKENIDGLPDNVKLLKWAPQADILAHSNCVLFITHGGLLSQHEAFHFGVPVISIPQVFDQFRNSRVFEEKGVGIQIFVDDINEGTITSAIEDITSNPSYRKNMKRLSAIFKDRPISPAESVVFWTEYVLRHGGAGHLRPASTELRWYQVALLDVLGICILIPISFLVVSFVLIAKFVLVKIKVR